MRVRARHVMRFFLGWGLIPVLGLAGVARAADVFPAEAGGLRIVATARFGDAYSTDGTVWKWGPGIIEVEVGVRNVSDHPITLPTRPYFSPVKQPRPRWFRLDLIAIEAPKLGNAPAKFNEARFDPVTLEPGEAILLDRSVATVDELRHARHLGSLIARYRVSGFPASLRWWSGTIGIEQPVEMHWQDPPKGFKE